MPEVIIEGLDELLQRLSATPNKVKNILRTTMEATLLKLWENVPPYPAPPAGSTYRRTGTLGRTLGSGGGQPSIYEVRENGGYIEGSFGTNLEYAPYVVGDVDTEQADHMRHWWTVPQTVLNRAIGGIEGLWQAVADEIANFLAGGG